MIGVYDPNFSVLNFPKNFSLLKNLILLVLYDTTKNNSSKDESIYLISSFIVSKLYRRL